VRLAPIFITQIIHKQDVTRKPEHEGEFRGAKRSLGNDAGRSHRPRAQLKLRTTYVGRNSGCA
jgi:hypothetical protein